MAITANASEYKSVVGLDSLYIAEVTVDTSTAYTADTPEYFAPAAEASVERESAMEIQRADDSDFDILSSKGKIKVSMKVTGVPMEMLAKINGDRFDSASGRIFLTNGEPPFIALSFRSKKSNGSYVYIQYLKGKFSMPKTAYATLGETPEPKQVELEFNAIDTTYEFDTGDQDEKLKGLMLDEDTTNASSTSFFSQVQTPSVVAPSALALSSSTPADAATGVVVSANQTLTFNNALDANALYNVVLIKASDGVQPAQSTGYPAIDADRKVITLNPAASLTAATAYIITYAVTDIYGQHLSGAINFTTA